MIQEGLTEKVTIQKDKAVRELAMQIFGGDILIRRNNQNKSSQVQKSFTCSKTLLGGHIGSKEIENHKGR